MVKGKGTMHTYFLQGNDIATIDEIIGKGKPGDKHRLNAPEKTDNMKSPADTPNRFFFQRGNILQTVVFLYNSKYS